LTDTTTAQLSAAVAQVSRVIAAQRASSNLPLLLAGFSQGACVALELACSGQNPPDALAACTGCRVGAATDSRPTALPRGLPVYLTGGDDDPWISVEAFGQAVTDLGRQGAALRADLFPARAHEVSPSEIAMLSAMLSDLSQARAPRLAASR
jgi:phospholipase/carboxylesterase